MEVVANNIANAFSTRTPQGGPFRRQDVVFETVYDDHLSFSSVGPHGPISDVDRLAGVRVEDIIEDPSELQRVYSPGHPDADASGFVLYPNVQIPTEMVNLITANRAYEANLKVLQAFRQQAEQALLLVRA